MSYLRFALRFLRNLGRELSSKQVLSRHTTKVREQTFEITESLLKKENA